MPEKTISEMWADAQVEFERLSRKPLDRGPLKSFEDVQAEIELRGDPGYSDDNKKDGWDRTKSVGLKVLHCLKLLAGVATQVSAEVCLPLYTAEICFKALSFALDIPQKIKDFNQAVNEVFTKICSVLSQFKIYEKIETIDELLARQVHRVMISFVLICAQTINYQQGDRWERFKRKAKASILNDDSGLSAEISRFEVLVKEHHGLEGTVTLKEVMEQRIEVVRVLEVVSKSGKRIERIDSTVQFLGDLATERKLSVDRIAYLTTIRDTLGIDSNVRLDTHTTKTVTNLFQQCLSGTGSWIWDHSAYKKWTMKDRIDSNPLLLVIGGSKCGKTSVSARITKKLEEQRGADTCTVHYFFHDSTGKSEDRDPIQSALKYMAFQVAKKDEATGRQLAKLCTDHNQTLQTGSLKSLWKELKLGAPRSRMMYYLIFDGLENLQERHANAVKDLLDVLFSLQDQHLRESSGSRVRVLVSGTEAIFQNRLEEYKSAVIDLTDCAIADMKICIDHELSHRGILQNPEPGSSQEKARRLIQDKLPQNTDGSFSLLQSGLENIIKQIRSGAGLEELEKSLKNSLNSHEATIENLHRSLEPVEVEQLNELLKWIMFNNGDLEIPQLQAAMFLYWERESLVPLAYVVEHRYSRVLRLDGSRVSVRVGVDKVLQKHRSNPRAALAGAGPRISLSIQITDVDRELCQNFLWDLSQKAIRDKFRFDFDNASAFQHTIQAELSVNEFDAHHTIVMAAFKFMRNEPDKRTVALGPYLFKHLPSHLKRLKEAQGLDELLDLQKQEIGSSLLELFESDHIFNLNKNHFKQFTWNREDVQVFREWFKDPAATRGIRKSWLRKATSEENPAKTFLGDLVLMIAQQWLVEGTWDARNAYDWICSFRSMAPKASISGTNTDNGEINPDPSVDYEGVSKWCQKILEIPDEKINSLWYEQLASAAALSNKTAEAIKYYTLASECENPRWLCYRGLGMSHSANSDHEDAVQDLERALEVLEASPSRDPAEIPRLHLLLGSCYSKIKDFKTAIEHYRSAITSEECAAEAWVGILSAQLCSGHDEECRKLIQTMRDSRPGDQTESWFCLTLRLLVHEADPIFLFARIFEVTSSESNLLEAFVQDMTLASAALGGRKHGYEEAEEYGMLLYQRGVASYLYGVPHGSEHPNGALRLWNECREELDNVGGFIGYWIHRAAVCALGRYYFHTMMENSDDSRYLEALQKLVDTGDGMGATIKWLLASLYVQRGQLEESKAVFRDAVRSGLQLLYDDTDQNDADGYDSLFMVLLPNRDPHDLATILSLRGKPDLVTERLTFEEEPAKALGYGIATKVRQQVPDCSKQLERIEAALELVASPESQSTAENPGSAQIISALNDLHSEFKSGQMGLFQGILECDGCSVPWNYEREMYHCLYCNDVIFCSPCLENLCSRPDPPRLPKCSSKHKWLKSPKCGADIYLGWRSKRVRVGGDIRPAETDGDRIFEAVWSSDEFMPVQDWKAALAAEWGLNMEDIVKDAPAEIGVEILASAT
ncbi:hypothetical protein GQ53DRAFT_736167 [Thozetella sp. PMI_491]|nr:hypothetical protein GQ53DRAFT_736167 [Thozetella sp. PMI_491]